MFFNRKRLPYCQLELVDSICQKSGAYTDKENSIYHYIICHRSTNFKLHGKYIWKRNYMNKRYVNELLYGIYLFLGVFGGTTSSQTMT